jgi:hypothetical protein
MKKYFLVICLFLSGCATSFISPEDKAVVQISPGVYEIFREDYRGVFGTEASLKNEVVADANTFANSQEKAAVPMVAVIRSVGFRPADWGWFYYKFRLVSKTDPDAKISISDIVVERDVRSSMPFLNAKNTQTRGAPVEELLKLDDLRKKGILSEAEFQSQKQKLLDQK